MGKRPPCEGARERLISATTATPAATATAALNTYTDRARKPAPPAPPLPPPTITPLTHPPTPPSSIPLTRNQRNKTTFTPNTRKGAGLHLRISRETAALPTRPVHDVLEVSYRPVQERTRGDKEARILGTHNAKHQHVHHTNLRLILRHNAKHPHNNVVFSILRRAGKTKGLSVRASSEHPAGTKCVVKWALFLASRQYTAFPISFPFCLYR